jgi:hypothetical protein
MYFAREQAQAYVSQRFYAGECLMYTAQFQHGALMRPDYLRHRNSCHKNQIRHMAYRNPPSS